MDTVIRYNPPCVTFADAGTEDIYNGNTSKASRAVCPQNLVSVARRKLFQLAAVEKMEQLRIPPGNRLEALRGDRTGQHSIRMNDQYRICFRWNHGKPSDVQIVDYH